MILVNDVKEHDINMIMEEEMPTNLTEDKRILLNESEVINNVVEKSDNQGNQNTPREVLEPKTSTLVKNDTKIHLNFSVERLLGAQKQCFKQAQQTEQCCDNSQKYYFSNSSSTPTILPYGYYKTSPNTEDISKSSTLSSALVKPTPIRAIGNTSDTSANISSPFANQISLMRFHGIQQAKQKSTQLAQTLQSLMTMPMHHAPTNDNSLLSSAQLYAMNSYQLQNPANFHLRISNASEKQNNSFFYNNNSNNNIKNNNSNNNNNYGNLISSTSTATSVATNPQNSYQQHNKQVMRNAASGRNNNEFSIPTSNGGGNKRKRSWSRAVFSNLQRKGLEIQFQQQKYITKPDRRKLAARLNLTDAQVKVWFQNRRMKWRHTRENLKSGQEKLVGSSTTTSTTVQSSSVNSALFKNLKEKSGETKLSPEHNQDYSSDGDTSIDGSEHKDNDEGDIDVVE